MQSSPPRRTPSTFPRSSEEKSPLSSERPRRFSSAPPPRHEDLAGANGNAVRFRPARLSAAELPLPLTCRFRCEGAWLGPLPVLDLATTGFAAGAPEDLALAPGSTLESLEILVDGRPIWTGEAVVVHENAERIGARFVSGVVDLRHVRLGATLDGRLSLLRAARDPPPEWRAAIADLVLLLESARLEVDEFDRSVPHDPIHRAEEEAELFARLRSRWGVAYFEAVAALHARSKLLDERSVQQARDYASSALLPILIACPLHRRAYEKPLGYAGDYRMMELYFAQDLAGDTLFGRFLHTIAQGYTLGRTVIAREALMRSVVREVAAAKSAANTDRPVRILSLASGPALELRRFLQEASALRRPVQLILLDQDEGALEVAYRRMQRILVDGRREELPVTVECLHFSVKQLLQPSSPEDARVFAEVLADLDLIYSAGLYDYLPEPVAVRLTRLLYSRLRPGGRLLLGNLTETPDSTWIMEYVLGWHLLYRTPEMMEKLAAGLSPAPSRVGIVRDATERRRSLLDITRGPARRSPDRGRNRGPKARRGPSSNVAPCRPVAPDSARTGSRGALLRAEHAPIGR